MYRSFIVLTSGWVLFTLWLAFVKDMVVDRFLVPFSPATGAGIAFASPYLLAFASGVLLGSWRHGLLLSPVVVVVPIFVYAYVIAPIGPAASPLSGALQLIIWAPSFMLAGGLGVVVKTLLAKRWQF